MPVQFTPLKNIEDLLNSGNTFLNDTLNEKLLFRVLIDSEHLVQAGRGFQQVKDLLVVDLNVGAP